MTSALLDDPRTTLRGHVLVDGRPVVSPALGVMAHVNPATGRPQQEFSIAGPDEVDAAVRSASAALPAWRQVAPAARAAALHEIARLFRERADLFSAISTLEAGMIRPMADFQGPRAAEWFDYYAGWADKLNGSTVAMTGALDYTVHEPYGVVAVILTWNGPTGTIGMKVAAALAAGCTVVLKPPELAPFSSVAFGHLCLDAGLPPGVVNVVPGDGVTGDALVRHPLVAKVSFTGGPSTGRLIQAACADSVKPVLLELGGKSANIVFADADLDTVAAHAVGGIVGLSGQACVAPTRLLVHDAVYDQLVQAVAERARAVRVGMPAEPDTQMGPVISGASADRIVAAAGRLEVESGGTILAGGARLGGELASGFFVAPTVVADVDNSSPAAQEEYFGPVVSAMRFGDEDAAVAIANDSPYGLAAYVHTRDVSRALRMAARLDAGNVSVNGGSAVSGPYAPFGGFKRSGYGKEGGLEGVLEYTRTKNVNIRI